MQYRTLFILVLLVLLSGTVRSAMDGGDQPIPGASAFVGQDLHMSGRAVISHQLSTGEHILVFRDGFSMSIGANQFSSDSAVVWLVPGSGEIAESAVRQGQKVSGGARIGYEAKIYLGGSLSVKKAKGARMTDLSETVIEQGRVMVIQFGVSGEVFVTADKRETAEARGLELYANAFAALRKAEILTMSAEAEPKPAAERVEGEEPAEVGIEPEDKEPHFRYPIHYSGTGEVAPKVEWDDKAKIVTWIGRLYLWQKQDEEGGLLELQADNAVIFLSKQEPGGTEKQAGSGGVFAGGAVEAIYLSGDVLMTEGLRTIRADEIYYNFEAKKALAVNAVMRSFDVSEGIPVYVRAAKLKQVAENIFAADDITLTTSEFYLPQISLNASSVIITDTTTLDEQQGRLSKGSYDAQMHDVRLKMYDQTIFYWPFLRSNLQRSDVPLKSVQVGHDRRWGTLVETRWYLSRLLGLEEPEGTESTLALDYYSERGFGAGIEYDYAKENYFGRILGYVINDEGEDYLGRTRKNIEPARELRGRFSWRHRQFLPYNWQLTTEVSYISDGNFLESFYRNEFYVGKQQETLVHMKRIEDNWGLSLLGKVRINDFVDELEELPSAEFHWTGQSFLDDKLTFYSDSQVSRFRQRYAADSVPAGSEQFFTFMSTRNEIDMPMTIGKAKVVPFLAGTVAYEDGPGFYSELDGGTAESEDGVWFGETGVRVSSQPYWKVFPDVKSQLWDLNQLRHLIRPYLTAVSYTQSDSVIEQRDTLNVGISQRLQTKRGIGDKQRTVDWMRLDMDVTWVNDSGDSSAGPDQFIWNRPFIPLVDRFGTLLGPQDRYDRRSGDIFGPRRNYIGADYIWRLSDTTAVLSDLNFDMQSGVVQQLNVGFSRLRWPDLSYYIGSRYLRRIDNGLGEKGSNMVTFAATYVLDPRYTAIYSAQYDFDYGAALRSDISLIRRYHRMYCGVTYSADASLDRQAIVFSVWLQGVPEIAIGPKSMGLGDSAGY
ncbi:MAG TPA: LPS assembly protein LptD [Sedimentisphaerales bacterium]|nr:LPS assembly protein LptD [Sedimentisphaerales bacterium]